MPGRLGMNMLYQVRPPFVVRRTILSPSAQPLVSLIMYRLSIRGEGTASGGIGVGVGVAGIQLKVDMTCAKTADSTALSKRGGGVADMSGLVECRTKSMLMQVPD